MRLLALLALLGCATGYYIPGVSAIDYKKGDEVKLRVSKLTSIHTLLPYGYYYLPYPKPTGGAHDAAEHGNLGDYLQGHEVQNSPYQLKMLENENCKVRRCARPMRGRC
jgi:hypothetical protein